MGDRHAVSTRECLNDDSGESATDKSARNEVVEWSVREDGDKYPARAARALSECYRKGVGEGAVRAALLGRGCRPREV